MHLGDVERVPDHAVDYVYEKLKKGDLKIKYETEIVSGLTFEEFLGAFLLARKEMNEYQDECIKKYIK